MRRIALKMLMGDRAKFFGILMGLTFASLLITQQMAIFIGLMTRSRRPPRRAASRSTSPTTSTATV